MNPESWGFIGTLVGAIVGASASIFTTIFNSKNAIRIQEEIDKNARKERFRNFQRDNLLELQEILSLTVGLIIKAYWQDLVNYKNGTNWEDLRLSSELNNEIADSFRELSIKTERIDNVELRNEISKLRRKMNECLTVDSFETREGNLMILTEKFHNVMPKLGKELRSNY